MNETVIDVVENNCSRPGSLRCKIKTREREREMKRELQYSL